MCAISVLQVRNQLRRGKGSAHSYAGQRWQTWPSLGVSNPKSSAPWSLYTAHYTKELQFLPKINQAKPMVSLVLFQLSKAWNWSLLQSDAFYPADRVITQEAYVSISILPRTTSWVVARRRFSGNRSCPRRLLQVDRMQFLHLLFPFQSPHSTLTRWTKARVYVSIMGTVSVM